MWTTASKVLSNNTSKDKIKIKINLNIQMKTKTIGKINKKIKNIDKDKDRHPGLGC